MPVMPSPSFEDERVSPAFRRWNQPPFCCSGLLLTRPGKAAGRGEPNEGVAVAPGDRGRDHGADLALREKHRREGLAAAQQAAVGLLRSEEHTSELQSLMRLPYSDL